MKKLLVALLMMFSSAAFAATELTTENYQAELTKALDSGKPVVLKFYAEWCPACQAMKPMYEKAEKDLTDKATFYIVNVDKNNALSRQINSIPTIIVIKKRGEAANPLVGVPPTQEALESAILERLK